MSAFPFTRLHFRMYEPQSAAVKLGQSDIKYDFSAMQEKQKH